MPVIIPDNLPAASVLARENIFTIRHARAIHQDIRPLRIVIVNLITGCMKLRKGYTMSALSSLILILFFSAVFYLTATGQPRPGARRCAAGPSADDPAISV